MGGDYQGWMGQGRAKDTIPDHYRSEGIEPWDIWEAFHLDPWSACAVKYILRAGRKGSAVDDWRKAQHYLQYLIDRDSGDEEVNPRISFPEELDRRREELPDVKPFCGDGVECGLVDCTRCGTPPPEQEPTVLSKPCDDAGCASPTVASEVPNPAVDRLRWYLDRFHNGGRR